MHQNTAFDPGSVVFNMALHSVAERVNNQTAGTFSDICDRLYTIVVLYWHLQAICECKEINIEDLYEM